MGQNNLINIKCNGNSSPRELAEGQFLLLCSLSIDSHTQVLVLSFWTMVQSRGLSICPVLFPIYDFVSKSKIFGVLVFHNTTAVRLCQSNPIQTKPIQSNALLSWWWAKENVIHFVDVGCRPCRPSWSCYFVSNVQQTFFQGFLKIFLSLCYVMLCYVVFPVDVTSAVHTLTDPDVSLM